MVTPVVVMGTRGDLRKTRYPFFYFIRAIIIPSSPAGSRLGMCEIQAIDQFTTHLDIFLLYGFFVSFFLSSMFFLLYFIIFFLYCLEFFMPRNSRKSISHIVRTGKNVTLDIDKL